MRRIIIPYYRELVDRARELRSAGTPTEIKLWNRLKRRHVRGCDFHRQKALLRFIVDFYCCERMLAIEIDGASHDGRDDYDLHRQQLLEGHGVRFLRFTADEIDDDIDEVVRTIERWLDAHPETPGVIA
jgi:very-short-patch-repair endonuclease